jgi:hypothetical protein
MSVQMIELEEVTMVETTDEALEAAQGGVQGVSYTNGMMVNGLELQASCSC